MARRSALPKYRHHKATGRAVVRLDGRDFYLGRFGSPESREAYARMLSDHAAGRSPGATRAAGGPTVAELVDAFQVHAARHYTGSNEAANYAPVQRLLLEFNASTPTADFGPRDLKRIRERLVADGAARSGINRSMVRLRTMFRWAVAEGLAPATVASALAMVRGLRAGELGAREAAPIRPVARELVESTLAHLPPTVAAMVSLQLLTGSRPGEVCALRPCDLDTSGPVWWYTPASHKTAHRGKVRRIPLIRAAQDLLRPFLLRPLASPCFSPAEAAEWCRSRRHEERRTSPTCGNVPGSNRLERPEKVPGDRYTSRTYSQAIRYALLRAFPAPPDVAECDRRRWRREHPQEAREWRASRHWAPNQLRHLIATEVRRRFGLEAARIVCGHSTAATTETYYAEVHAGQAAEYLERIA